MGLLVWKSLVGLVGRRRGEEDGRQFLANLAVADEPLRFLFEKMRVADPFSREREPGSRFLPSMDRPPVGAVSGKEVVARYTALRKAKRG